MRFCLLVLLTLVTFAQTRPKFPAMVDNAFPRGSLTFAGVVLRCTPDRLLVRTHKDGTRIFLLRGDTSYLVNGTQGDSTDLPVHAHVFIRAGRGLEDELEAYQVVWGVIVQPRESYR
jgi:hypothetical protein